MTSSFTESRGNAHSVEVIGSGQKTTTGHGESSLSETGIDPRIEIGLPKNESVLVLAE